MRWTGSGTDRGVIVFNTHFQGRTLRLLEAAAAIRAE
jgi:hypothetical protein